MFTEYLRRIKDHNSANSQIEKKKTKTKQKKKKKKKKNHNNYFWLYLSFTRDPEASHLDRTCHIWHIMAYC